METFKLNGGLYHITFLMQCLFLDLLEVPFPITNSVIPSSKFLLLGRLTIMGRGYYIEHLLIREQVRDKFANIIQNIREVAAYRVYVLYVHYSVYVRACEHVCMCKPMYVCLGMFLTLYLEFCVSMLEWAVLIICKFLRLCMCTSAYVCVCMNICLDA